MSSDRIELPSNLVTPARWARWTLYAGFIAVGMMGAMWVVRSINAFGGSLPYQLIGLPDVARALALFAVMTLAAGILIRLWKEIGIFFALSAATGFLLLYLDPQFTPGAHIAHALSDGLETEGEVLLLLQSTWLIALIVVAPLACMAVHRGLRTLAPQLQAGISRAFILLVFWIVPLILTRIFLVLQVMVHVAYERRETVREANEFAWEGFIDTLRMLDQIQTLRRWELGVHLFELVAAGVILFVLWRVIAPIRSAAS